MEFTGYSIQVVKTSRCVVSVFREIAMCLVLREVHACSSLKSTGIRVQSVTIRLEMIIFLISCDECLCLILLNAGKAGGVVPSCDNILLIFSHY